MVYVEAEDEEDLHKQVGLIDPDEANSLEWTTDYEDCRDVIDSTRAENSASDVVLVPVAEVIADKLAGTSRLPTLARCSHCETPSFNLFDDGYCYGCDK